MTWSAESGPTSASTATMGTTSLIDPKQVEPAVLDGTPHNRVFVDHSVDRLLGRPEEGAQPKRRVQESTSIMDRLHREADSQISTVAFEDAHRSTDHVNQHLVARAESLIVRRRRIVLRVDPVCHQHGRRHDPFEHGELVVLLPVVLLEEHTTVERSDCTSRSRRCRPRPSSSRRVSARNSSNVDRAA